MAVVLLGNPALKLEATTLEGGWEVRKLIPIGRQTTNGTGGTFSVAYEVVDGKGRRAFLKALDYSQAMMSADPSTTLLNLTSAYKFECEVLRKIGERHLDRVVQPIATGNIQIDQNDAKGIVEYIIFEMADGDVRKYIESFSEKFDIAWRLRCLHHIATGLSQLHSNSIVHQDTKPSNILVFDGLTSKLGDLGRSSYEGHLPSHDQIHFAGDPQYVPVDLAYGRTITEWKQRKACDLYHLGSMIAFLFVGTGMTPLLFSNLDKVFIPRWFGGEWGESFEQVLPYVRNAFDKSLEEFGSQLTDLTLRTELVTLIRYLCEPDPLRRGHPKDGSVNGNSYQLHRFITKFDLLAKRAEYGTFKE